MDLTSNTGKQDGQFVAKVQASHRAHNNPNEIFRELGDYTRSHTPQIVFSDEDTAVSVAIYDLAGFSIETTRTLREVRNQNDRHHVIVDMVAGLLTDQLGPNNRRSVYTFTATEVLEQWLGASFWQIPRYSTLISGTSLGLSDDAQIFRFATELFPNPVAAISSFSTDDNNKVGVLSGVNHGDLHTANVIVQGTSLNGRLDHWVIDANWPDEAPLFYDYAYLEVSLILDALSAASHLEILSVLRAVNLVTDSHQLDSSHTDLVSNLRAVRDTLDQHLTSHQERRTDVWRTQLILARIAAGLNWASKPTEPHQRTAALLYASWSTREWLERYAPERWQSMVTEGSTAQLLPQELQLELPLEAGEVNNRLHEYWEELQGLPADTDLIVISGRIRGLNSKIETLATLQISAIVDLDPDSDTAGLQAALGGYLRVSRRLNVFGAHEHLVSTRRSTNWLMANGWTTRSEAAAPDLTTWRRGGFLARVRRAIDHVVAASTSRSVCVLAIRDESTRDMSLRVLEYVDEVYGGIAAQIDLNASRSAGDSVHKFVDVRENAIISDVPSAGVSLPGKTGRVGIDVVTLQRFEADLELLHDQILTGRGSVNSSTLVDEFWRGRPPTWDELASGVDIRRAVEPDVIKACRTAINDGRSTIIRLDHSPGAGATTLVRRVAWELMAELPVVFVFNFSETTGEMIAEISKMTDLPILVFAESAVVSESDRDVLFETTTENHGRVVIVWVNRTTMASERSIKLIDPMNADESVEFVRAFSKRCRDDNSRQELLRMADEYATLPKQCHSPFYYGLTAFERKFSGIENFVSNHLVRLTPLQMKVAQYLALITRYSQVGLYPGVVRRWLGCPERPPHEITDKYLVATLGADLRHLVVSDGSAFRLLHPIVAEGVLSYFHEKHGGLSLAQISVRLIEQVHEVLGESSEPALFLLRSIFITRSGEFRRDGFSEVVSRFTPEEGQLVFEKLTETFPKEAHFWNHRGRFHIYKVRGDYATAESYLKLAVETATPSMRGTHLHTLGMVRRLWVEHQISEMAIAANRLEGTALIDAIRPTYDAAMAAFHDSRMVGSGSNYSWVTPIQLTNTVVEFLIKQAGVSNLHELLAADNEVSDWVADQMHQSESLLDVVRVDAIERTQSRDFYSELSGKIDALYGDIDTLVEQWKAISESGQGDSARLGCSMARAVFSAAERSWANVDEARARQLTDMLQPAIDSGTASDADLRTWIQAYRRLPEYSTATALERVTYYASERNSVEGAYYSYILSFQLWANGALVDESRVRHYLELCKRLSRNRRQDWSYEWISSDGRGAIVHFSELGRWTRDRRQVWSESGRLGRVRGVIEDVDGYRSGFVRVGAGSILAFFAPQGDILASRDINEVADFYLGFSFSGLRGWSVKVTSENSDVDLSADNLQYSPMSAAIAGARKRAPRRTKAPKITKSPSAPIRATSLSPLEQEFLVYFDEVCGKSPDGLLQVNLSQLGNLLIKQFGNEKYRKFKSLSKTLYAGLARLGLDVRATGAGYEISRSK